MYDIIVIGAGLMGAAAIRHLAKNYPDLSLAVIGASEPVDFKTHEGVFASHYDQGRITRVLDRSPVWGHLAAHSISRYAEIEAESGITFHHKVGCLRVHDTDEAVNQVQAVAATHETVFDVLNPAQSNERFPYFSFDGDFTAFAETGNSGYINPRQLVQAQLAIAEQHGATIIHETVTGFDETDNSVQVTTSEGQSYQAQKILLTTGGFTNLLLHDPLDFRLIAHNIILAELPESEIKRLENMPSLITGCENPVIPTLYLLPPVVYPDGKTYIKLGGSFRGAGAFEETVTTREELAAWFQSDGDESIGEMLKAQLHTLVPDLQVVRYDQKPCLLTMTAHGFPYIGAINERVFVTTGGNGSSAKSSDEIGRLGAMLCATGEWDSPLDQDNFRVIHQNGG